MQEKNYRWNHKAQRYEQQVGELSQEPGKEAKEPTGNEEEVIQLLMQNKDKLLEVLNNADAESLPRYSISGVRIAKTIHLSHKLNELIKQFTEDKDLKQREFFELAALELMKKYGYEAEIKGLME